MGEMVVPACVTQFRGRKPIMLVVVAAGSSEKEVQRGFTAPAASVAVAQQVSRALQTPAAVVVPAQQEGPGSSLSGMLILPPRPSRNSPPPRPPRPTPCRDPSDPGPCSVLNDQSSAAAHGNALSATPIVTWMVRFPPQPA